MQERRFWDIIDAAVHDDRDTQLDRLREQLSGLTQHQLIAFDQIYHHQLKRAWHWDLWAAAYILNDGCSDDCFDYFCDYLISRGRDVFEEALKDPESLIGRAEPYETDFEDYRYVAAEVLEAEFDRDMPIDRDLPPRGEPEGESWDEDEVYDRLPRLSEWVATDFTRSQPESWSQKHLADQRRNEWRKIFMVGGLILGVLTFAMTLKSNHDRAEIRQMWDQLKTPSFFAQVCEMNVKWYDKPDPTAQQVFDENLQSYKSVQARLPVDIQTENGREIWRVTIETETDRFLCEDFADQYDGILDKPSTLTLTKLEPEP